MIIKDYTYICFVKYAFIKLQKDIFPIIVKFQKLEIENIKLENYKTFTK
tara:strand:+ start:62 stop:208 length:147 start_codon:yes stop_codon:yes gene_type:complete